MRGLHASAPSISSPPGSIALPPCDATAPFSDEFSSSSRRAARAPLHRALLHQVGDLHLEDALVRLGGAFDRAIGKPYLGELGYGKLPASSEIVISGREDQNYPFSEQCWS